MFPGASAAAKMAQEIARQEEMKKKRRTHQQQTVQASSSENHVKRSVSIDEASSVANNVTVESPTSRAGKRLGSRFRGSKKLSEASRKPARPMGVTTGQPVEQRAPRDSTTPILEQPLDAKHQKATETLSMIRQTITSQEARETQLEATIVSLKQEAQKALSNGKKKSALRSMKMVKQYQCESDKISCAIETMNSQCLSIESALNNTHVVQAMQAGANTMKTLQSQVTVDQFDHAMDSIRDMADYAAEVHQILSRPTTIVMEDDEDLLKELAAMSDENVGLQDDARDRTILSMPNAPTTPFVEGRPEARIEHHGC